MHDDRVTFDDFGTDAARGPTSDATETASPAPSKSTAPAPVVTVGPATPATRVTALAPRQRRRLWPMIPVVLLPLGAAGLWAMVPASQPWFDEAATFAADRYEQVRPLTEAAMATARRQIDAGVAALVKQVSPAPPVVIAEKRRGIRVMTVSLTVPREARAFTGVVAARYETRAAFRVGGKILTRAVEVGQQVKKGDMLMRLDDADHQAALGIAAATLAAAEAVARQTAADAARQAKLLKQGFATQQTFDRAEALARSSADQVEAARQQVALARNTLAYASLLAPVDGIVTAISVEAGQVVAEGQTVLTIVRAGEREAVVAIPEGQIADLGTFAATAEFWAGGGAPGPAVLREVSPQADPASRTHQARYTLPGTADSVDLGATVTIRLERATGAPVAYLPTTAIAFRDGRPFVWVVTDAGDHVAAKPVEIVVLGSETSAVRGPGEGDRVATLGVNRLDEALAIRVIEMQTIAEARP